MTNLKFILGVIAICMVFSTSNAQIQIPAPSPLATVTQKFGLGEIKIEYSRPVANDRKIFGGLVPFDKVWRTGANATTQITFSDDVTIQGKLIKAGTYGIYTIPHANEWEIMLYSDLKLGGNINDYDIKNEVARFKSSIGHLNYKVESFTINLDNVKPTSAILGMAWENTGVGLEITTNIDDRVMKSIDESIKSEKPAYYQAASYYFNNGKDLKTALEWVNKAIAENPSSFWMTLLKAKIEYKLDDKVAGKKSAQQTIEAATKAKSTDYIKLAEDLIEANK